MSNSAYAGGGDYNFMNMDWTPVIETHTFQPHNCQSLSVSGH